MTLEGLTDIETKNFSGHLTSYSLQQFLQKYNRGEPIVLEELMRYYGMRSQLYGLALTQLPNTENGSPVARRWKGKMINSRAMANHLLHTYTLGDLFGEIAFNAPEQKKRGSIYQGCFNLITSIGKLFP